MSEDPRARYSAAGVDVAAGEALVERIKPAAASTARSGCTPALGGFAGLFDLAAAGHSDSLLVASTDGVGTKLRLAIELGRHRGVGIDLVAMCVNDIIAQGAEPLVFLDYYASGSLDVAAAAQVIEGIAEGCRTAGCALLGGETAEMPGHYAAGDYDLAGFVLGAVPRTRVLPRDVRTGDTLIALAASGAHSNGFSLIRRLAADRDWDLSAPFGDTSLGETLLTPTRIYVRPVLAALDAHDGAIHGIAHITGGGLTGNVPRMLPDDLAAEIDRASLPRSDLMAFLAAEGRLSAAEMEATFNCGTGLVMAVDAHHADAVLATLRGAGETAVPVGHVARREDASPQCLVF